MERLASVFIKCQYEIVVLFLSVITSVKTFRHLSGKIRAHIRRKDVKDPRNEVITKYILPI